MPNEKEIMIDGWKIFGQSLRDYLHYQFPATRGHIPLDEWLDKFERCAGLLQSMEDMVVDAATEWIQTGVMSSVIPNEVVEAGERLAAQMESGPAALLFSSSVGYETEIDYDKKINCAAIKMPDGRVWTGHRHSDCIKTIIQACPEIKRVGNGSVQGFVTMAGRFVDRAEAGMIALHAGQVEGKTLPFDLFSEDLY